MSVREIKELFCDVLHKKIEESDVYFAKANLHISKEAADKYPCLKEERWFDLFLKSGLSFLASYNVVAVCANGYVSGGPDAETVKALVASRVEEREHHLFIGGKYDCSFKVEKRIVVTAVSPNGFSKWAYLFAPGFDFSKFATGIWVLTEGDYKNLILSWDYSAGRVKLASVEEAVACGGEFTMPCSHHIFVDGKYVKTVKKECVFTGKRGRCKVIHDQYVSRDVDLPEFAADKRWFDLLLAAGVKDTSPLRCGTWTMTDKDVFCAETAEAPVYHVFTDGKYVKTVENKCFLGGGSAAHFLHGKWVSEKIFAALPDVFKEKKWFDLLPVSGPVPWGDATIGFNGVWVLEVDGMGGSGLWDFGMTRQDKLRTVQEAYVEIARLNNFGKCYHIFENGKFVETRAANTVKTLGECRHDFGSHVTGR